MDILHLVDRMEELFNSGKQVPLTRNVMVDENAFMDIIDQMRISIPEEIKSATNHRSKRPNFGTSTRRS